MGMMLETTSRRLFETKGEAHYGSPDKDPEVRLRVLEDAGRLSIPFTTGLLVGIGETLTERAETIFALRERGQAVRPRAGGDRPELPGQARHRHAPQPTTSPSTSTAPPSRSPGWCSDPRRGSRRRPTWSTSRSAGCCSAAGVDDWGGVSPLTPDHVNPERPWPSLERPAHASPPRAGFELQARLTVHPEYVVAGEPWLDPRVLRPRRGPGRRGRRASPRPGVRPIGLPWQEPDRGLAHSSTGRADLHTAVDTEGRTADRRSDFDTVYGDWDSLRSGIVR